MPNHYHLAMATPEPNLVAGMEGKLGDHHSGELHRASASAEAVRHIGQRLPSKIRVCSQIIRTCGG